MAGHADRNLLFGVLAMQMDFITREQLIAGMQAWVFDKSKSLGDLLIAQNALGADSRELLERLVEKNLEIHGNDVEKSLASITSVKDVRKELEHVTDADVQASLGNFSLGTEIDPYATIAPKNLAPGTNDGDAAKSASKPHAQSALKAGRFRIIRPHARGGLGEVYVARDQELNREVALKEIQDKQADNVESRSRFMLEAEITGGLEHPGIVPVYGLGAYPDGRPYYAMRFIRGDSLKDAIDRFHKADKAGMSPGQRAIELRGLLGRFIDVCNAIAYAHSRGVLHRDLKPGNIMLGKYGETLVVDWGLAKPLGAPPDKPVSSDPGEGLLMPSSLSLASATMAGAAVGTPQYMSPEQALGKLDELGPASDVYSLGATLFAVLTGQSPVGDTDVFSVIYKVQRGEIRRPREVNPNVPAPLDAICMKAMSLAQKDRYASPKDFADDIEQWLADEPVSAWQEPFTVTAKRWIGRRAAFVTFTATAIVIALISLIVTTILLTAANERERIAKEKAEDNYKLARSAVDRYYTEVSEDVLLKEPGMEPLRKKLLRGAGDFYAQFVKDRAGDATVQGELGKATYRLAQITADIDSPKQGIALHLEAAKLFETLPGTQMNADFKTDQAACYHHLGRLYRLVDEPKKAEERYGQALKLWDELGQVQPRPKVVQAGTARTQMGLGNLHQYTRDLDKAQASYQQSLAGWKALADAEPEVVEYQRDLSVNYSNLAQVYLAMPGKDKQAESALRSARAIQRNLAKDAPNVSKYQDDVARTCYNLGDLLAGPEDDEAEAAYREAAERWQFAVDKNPAVTIYHIRLAMAHAALANLHRRQQDFMKAEVAGQLALKVQRGIADRHKDDPRHQASLAKALYELAEVHRAAGHETKGQPVYAEAIGLLDKLAADHPGSPHYQRDLAHCWNGKGQLEAQLKQDAKAIDAYKKAIDCWDKLIEAHPSEVEYAVGLSSTYVNLGDVMQFVRNFKDAADWYTRAAACFDAKKVGAIDTPAIRSAQCLAYEMRAGALTKLGRYPDALEDWNRTLELEKPERKPVVLMYRAAALARTGRYSDAAAEAEKLVPSFPSPAAQYQFAGVYALAAAAAKVDERLTSPEREKTAEPLAARGVQLLATAASLGYFDGKENQQKLQTDPDMQILRMRADYKSHKLP
jgi:serine/threonine-protein kinase